MNKKVYSSDDESYSSVYTDKDAVVYLDFHSTKNFDETIEYLTSKAKRLHKLGFSRNNIIDILVYGDDLKGCILNSSLYELLVNVITENISIICTSNSSSEISKEVFLRHRS